MRSTAVRVMTGGLRAARKWKWRHALGETVRIVLAVLIALGVNNWNAHRQERRLELVTLRQLRSALAGDLNALRAIRADVRVKEQRIESLRAHLDKHLPYADSLTTNFGAVILFWNLTVNRSPYEALKVKGFSLISSDSLRLRIVAMYDHVYVELENAQADDRAAVLDAIRPYYLKNFRDIHFGDRAIPLDYGAVARDPYFRNLIDYRLAAMRKNTIAASEVAIGELAGLIAMLDSAIARQH